MTEEIFRHDSYCRECEATVVSSGPDGIVLDRTVFYPNGGGQPGDQGVLRTTAGDVTIVDTLKGA
ncbi:MAG: alanine--tRNA ligase-related protein, partial [Pseudomonadota bacterium]|nr:alanine--tRNA ligase-related protein [Pseudomonadota bacterium]